MKKKPYIILPVFIALLFLAGCLGRKAGMERIGKHMVDRYVKNTKELSIHYNEALWKVLKWGSKEDYEELVKVGMEQMIKGPGNASREQAALEFYGKKLDLVFEDVEGLEIISTILASGELKDSLLIRELEMLRLHLLNRQSNIKGKEELMNKDHTILQEFPTYRPVYRGDTLDENILYRILYRSTSSREVKDVWTALMGFGAESSEEIIRSVKLKNLISRELGYSDYYQLEMSFYEEDSVSIENLFREFEEVTRKPYIFVKSRVDSMIMLQYNIEKEQIRPWHYQAKYFSRLPASETPELFYSAYDSCELVPTLESFFGSINLPVTDIVERSELENRNPGININLMMNIDFKNDIRVITGETGSKNRDLRLMFHEFGHAVQNKYTDPAVPYLLRSPNLALAEAIGVLFERRYYDPGLLSEVLQMDVDMVKTFLDQCRPIDEMNHLVYERFIYLMATFEKELFHDPEQDLNALWYSLMKDILLIDCPERKGFPDWAASRHVFLSHAMVHNYLLADIIAAQLIHSMENDLGGQVSFFETGIYGRQEVGEWLIINVFSYGNSIRWDRLIRQATGEDLNCKNYLKQYSHIPFASSN